MHVEQAINQLHISLATGNQSTSYQSIWTHNKIDDLNHQDNGILVASYFSNSQVHLIYIIIFGKTAFIFGYWFKTVTS